MIAIVSPAPINHGRSRLSFCQTFKTFQAGEPCARPTKMPTRTTLPTMEATDLFRSSQNGKSVLCNENVCAAAQTADHEERQSEAKWPSD
jgi:hypothetical protein